MRHDMDDECVLIGDKPTDCGNTFASRLKFLRFEKKLSVEVLADKLKIDSELIEDWEAGWLMVDLPMAIKLARFFYVNLGFLVGCEDRQYVVSRKFGTFTL